MTGTDAASGTTQHYQLMTGKCYPKKWCAADAKRPSNSIVDIPVALPRCGVGQVTVNVSTSRRATITNVCCAGVTRLAKHKAPAPAGLEHTACIQKNT